MLRVDVNQPSPKAFSEFKLTGVSFTKPDLPSSADIPSPRQNGLGLAIRQRHLKTAQTKTYLKCPR